MAKNPSIAETVAALASPLAEEFGYFLWDVEYVKEVAAEMEAKNDPEEFIRKFKEESGSHIAVTDATEHDSEDADEAIRRNGYHYLSGKVLELYNSRTEAQAKPQEATAPAARRTERQRKVKSGAAVKNSNIALNNALNRSRMMCDAN